MDASATLSPTAVPPVSDPLHALAVSPGVAVDGLCFAARQSGLYRSTDGGATWAPALGATAAAPTRAPTPTATCVAFSPDFAGDRTLFAGALGGVMRSRDGGRTWRVSVLPPPPPLVSGLVVSPAFAEDGVVVAGTVEDGILHSADRGETWRRWNFGLLDLSVLALAISPVFAADEALFAGTETGVFVSANGGRAWKETGFPDAAAPILALAVSSRFGEDGVVWAGTERHGLWRSADRGASWERVGGGMIDGAVNQIVLASADAVEDLLLVAQPEALLLSRDGGTTWAVVAEERIGGGIASVAAPFGLVSGATLLLGRRDGSLTRVSLGA